MTLRPNEPGVRLAFGVPGAGKSHGISRDVHASVRAGVPVIVLDPMHEWERVPPNIVERTRRKTTVAEAIAALDGGETRLAIVSPDDLPAATEEACAWALDPARKAEVKGIAIHEAWEVAPSSGAMGPEFLRAVRAWRHRNIAMWLDSQRISMMSRNVVDIARSVRIYALVGDRDFAVLNEIGGKELVSAVQECAARFDRGEPGWHVALRSSRRPPYTPERSPA